MVRPITAQISFSKTLDNGHARDVRELQEWPRLPDSVQPLSAPQPVSTAHAINRGAPAPSTYHSAQYGDEAENTGRL